MHSLLSWERWDPSYAMCGKQRNLFSFPVLMLSALWHIYFYLCVFDVFFFLLQRGIRKEVYTFFCFIINTVGFAFV